MSEPSSLRQQFSDLLKEEHQTTAQSQSSSLPPPPSHPVSTLSSTSPSVGELSSRPPASSLHSSSVSSSSFGPYVRVVLALIVVGLIAILVKNYDKIKEYVSSLLSTVSGSKREGAKREGKKMEGAAGKPRLKMEDEDEGEEEEGGSDPMFQPFPKE